MSCQQISICVWCLQISIFCLYHHLYTFQETLADFFFRYNNLELDITLKMGRMMVEIPIPPKWKQLWDIWDLRCVIILSLSLQTFLILAAPLRKRTKSNWIVIPLWSAYLLADWAANFAVGLISSSQGNPDESSGKKDRTPVENEDLLAFWAPFLLVHLGGPDTITAFALEDNELWGRHLLSLFFQCLAAVYVFVQSLPHNRLWIPTMLMLMTGIIKFSERTRSLYLASADKFKESMLTQEDAGPNYAKLMDEYVSKKQAKLPTSIIMVPEPNRAAKSANKAKRGNLTQLEVVQYGYMFFQKFKGLVVETIFNRKERNHSRDFFLNRTAEDAFKVVEVELNFIYDVLFTKLPVVYDKIGVICRFFSLVTVFLSIIIFILKGKSNFLKPDITITYGLLFGALVLDVTALFMLLFSDWTVIFLRESPDIEPEKAPKSKILNYLKTQILTKFLRIEGTLKDSKQNGKSKPCSWMMQLIKRRTEGTLQVANDDARSITTNKNKSRSWMKYLMKRRWSESISTYNLIYYCLHPRPNLFNSVFDKLGLSWFLDSIFYVKYEPFSDDLKDLIFKELKSKSELADDLETAKEISSARGDWVLRAEEGWSGLLNHVVEVDYDHSLILWHLATELCYNEEIHNKTIKNTKQRQNSKLLSDYMLYLLIMQPGLMSAVAGIGQIRFRDTCAEAKRFFEDVRGENKKQSQRGKEKDEYTLTNACMDILKVSTEVEPVTIKGDRSKSLLFDGCILANELMKIEREAKLDKWEIISKVWVELLCYAASHSRANMQAAEVSKGGELITIVWLLMAHLGLGDQFQISEGQARAKLIVGK
ncbi:hypothetical protein L1987_60644 [Smallanthus sonchifolius]|uniref:Uncharacterized protein n=1 Tax=Smallanthus sonchifolius TaxID=185202 RepID=A0ACB9D8V7_9ASTR|nr:hypothetical protein L1987_60644 [Smallanthus sonchifolius]